MTDRSHLTPTELSGWIANALAPDARRAVEAHLEACTECREELVEVVQLGELPNEQGARRAPGRRRWWVPAVVAAGLAAVLIPRGRELPAPAPAVERPAIGPSESMPRLIAVAPPPSAGVARPGMTFTWRGAPGAAYRLTILAEDGAPLWTQETPDTTLTLAPEVRLEGGRRYFWRVDAMSDGVVATTGVNAFRVVPE